MEDDILFATASFAVQVNPDSTTRWNPVDNTGFNYQVINKSNGIIEAATKECINACSVFSQLQYHMDKRTFEIDTEEEATEGVPPFMGGMLQ